MKLPFPRRAHITGHVDGIRDHAIVGWATDRASPDEVLDVSIVADGKTIAQGKAQDFRPDLLAAGIGHGRYGFAVPLPEPLPPAASLAVTASRAEQRGTGSPLQMEATARVGVLRAYHARTAAVEPPRDVVELCESARRGKFAPTAAPATEAERVYLSDDLFMKTMLAVAERLTAQR